MTTTTISTTLLESVNIVLANLGEAPVNTLTGSALPQQVSLALNTIEEVSTDIQSKGWWFNQQTGSNYDTAANIVIYPSNTANDWSASIPEEARRYITIRSSRIAQTRLIGSEELQKFSYNEELVSLAILQQAHVRNSNGVLDFTSFPTELKSLGVDEVMFLQGSVEEKIGTLRLGSELANTAKTKAETALIADQEALVTQQKLTEIENTSLVTQNAIKTAAEAGLVTTQQSLIAQQVLDVVADIALKTKQGTKIDEETDLLETQDLLTSAQKDTELQNAIKVAAEAGLVTSQQALVAQQVLDTVADTALKGAQKLKIDSETLLVGEQKTLVTKQALTEVQNAIKVSADAGLVTTQQALVSQQVLDSAADVILKGKQSELADEQKSLVTKQTLTEIQNALKVSADTGLVTNQQALVAQQVLDTVAETAIKESQKLKIDAEKLLVDEQKALVTKQALTEVQNALKVSADAGLITSQQALVSQQVLESVANVSNITADVTIKTKQGALIDAQAVTEAQNAIKVAADAGLVTSQQALISQQTLDVAQDTILKGKQGSLIDAQATTEGKRATDIEADTTLKGKQGIKLDAETGLTTQQQALTAQQTLDVVADTELKGKQGSAIDADIALKTSQKTQLDAQTAIEATAEKAFYDGVVAGTQSTYRDYAAEMRIMGIQESQFQETPAYKKIELIADATKLRTSTATATTSDSAKLYEVNKIMRLIGEPPVSTVGDNSLSSEAFRLLEDTDLELQGRGWWFNTEKDVEFTPVQGKITISNLGSVVLSVEANDYKTRFESVGASLYLYDLDKKSYQDWGTAPIKGTVIYRRTLNELSYKYREYLNVRTAILLTELYPQSGIDIQRLPKMEAELRSYFKDRENDEANYNVFDSYDAATRIGINRNYDLF